MTIKDLSYGQIAVIIQGESHIKGRCIYKLGNVVYWITGNTIDIILPQNNYWNNVEIKLIGRIQ